MVGLALEGEVEARPLDDHPGVHFDNGQPHLGGRGRDVVLLDPVSFIGGSLFLLLFLQVYLLKNQGLFLLDHITE